ncbi:hypothetical protein BATDEDRAFT_35498 [Batrachochytrium dendrobatidis JAM81]|uniref:Glutamate--cysteine ligase n=2 Tax=Batrachochytrium dendrobatidis TaxID=109871 RepID=F4P754_BATDJ|nr:glutamate--cysteine ligase [Batrachochytrium dendrobatidis JAM81]EGF79020.1 hypothetical protein BATDEDRAFT_35498 [Batrachochytrium dendrobatidis JAM81]KAK5667520.1 glutamate--cysteine ligase [Batrachochytrium dendrobatidis]OAJ42386.1 glutamate-cysteine ligase [Batrachochytrium dendrobatidis JEL423]|eukprot:XP_006680396.1 hypothetical protein BATDEDRAFT_35498 [Batrachochytrium dendrobatidis JAM81]
MGLLSLGTPLSWEDLHPHADHVRTHGIAQFLNIWNRVKSRRKDHLLWGDEIEYVVVELNKDARTARLALDASVALDTLSQMENDTLAAGGVPDSSWKPEYGRYMLEGTPGVPYGSTVDDLLTVEENMRKRRALGNSLLKSNQSLFTFTNFPRLGCTDKFIEPSFDPTPGQGASMSLFIPQQAITQHARFPTLTANIRKRRGSKVAINLPIFKDTNTPSPFREPVPRVLKEYLASQHQPIPASLPDYTPDAKEDHIYMDSMCFGMGCSCLQVTFQACSVEEARRLYDQLSVVAPIMLALTAAAPIYRGMLADVDCRWNVISGSVDDRTLEERGKMPLKNSKFKISKSRYDSVSRYLSPGPNYSGGCCNKVESEPLDLSAPPPGSGFYKDEYNDLDVAMDMEVYAKLVDAGVDDLLAKHYAHLFIRDPLVVFRELLDQDDQTSSDHFENIQSTNWQSMRFKPPPPSAPNMGWRVEFRSMEIQLTDHENAVFSIFVVLLTRTILAYNLNFYIPLSKVDENMQTAQKRDAVLNETFWFRRDIFANSTDPPSSCRSFLPHPFNVTPSVSVNSLNASNASSCSDDSNGTSPCLTPNGIHIPSVTAGATPNTTHESNGSSKSEFRKMGINCIMNGNGVFPGLLPLIGGYLDNETEMSDTTRLRLKQYLSVISQKASGERMTAAAWTRDFVTKHTDYKHDSVVSESMTYDLCRAVQTLFADDLIRKK